MSLDVCIHPWCHHHNQGHKYIYASKYSKTLVCERNSFWKHAFNPKHSSIKVNSKNYWLSCDHVMLGITYYWYLQVIARGQVKIYEKCLLILWNTHRLNCSQSKIMSLCPFVFVYLYCVYMRVCMCVCEVHSGYLTWERCLQ